MPRLNDKQEDSDLHKALMNNFLDRFVVNTDLNICTDIKPRLRDNRYDKERYDDVVEGNNNNNEEW